MSGISSRRFSDTITALRLAGCVFAEDEAALLSEAAQNDDDLDALVHRRIVGEPLEQIVGWAEFAGLRLVVEPGVFVPRRRTEFLAQVSTALAAPLVNPVVLDLCCGVGAVGLAVSTSLRDVELLASDCEASAVRCARANIGARGRVFEGDLYDPLPSALRGKIDVVAANAPYVPSRAIELMPREARDWEPRSALDGGTDGLAIQRRVLAAAGEWLSPRGRVVVETSERQARETARLFADAGLTCEILRCDDVDATVVSGGLIHSRPVNEISSRRQLFPWCR
ncbi:putative protein N(5)-glutamine methyltransferase [Okibacterium endophyticum]